MTHSIAKSVRVFSGIQPTGIPHLGNYFGALARWIDIANRRKVTLDDKQYDCETPIYCIVDIHAYSSRRDFRGADLYQKILQSTASLMALGLDPTKCILFRQSDLMEHCYLRSVFDSCVTTARLGTMIQYKEKARAQSNLITNAILNYPVLQAADILLYKTNFVPVGEDQFQHLELTRDIARVFNKSTKSALFPDPQALKPESEHSLRVKSLRDPTSKMSKSDPSENSVIEVTESPETIVKKLNKALTDCSPDVSYDLEKRPGVSNLLTIYHLATGSSIEKIVEDFEGKKMIDFKTSLAEVLIEKFKFAREEFVRLEKDRCYLEKVLKEGAERSRPLASETIREVKHLLGSQREDLG